MSARGNARSIAGLTLNSDWHAPGRAGTRMSEGLLGCRCPRHAREFRRRRNSTWLKG